MSLVWNTSNRAQQGSLAYQFPSFQINAKDARRGAVKVEARAPSGRIQELSVGDTNGVFTTNFTPTEVGDWQISIKYDGEHIQGSPFNVRVYDAAQVKVFGLQGGTVGKQFSFNVDTSNAGAGELTVDITHQGRKVPGSIQQEPGTQNQYKVNFTPTGSGIYTIRVYFAGIEVNGSPYTLEIVDSSNVTAVGEGLSTVEVNRSATFIVNTGNTGAGGDVRVDVTGPRGNRVPSNVTDNRNGTFSVQYTPSDVGEYIVDVFFYGRAIKGSPFKVHAFDWSSIQVRNMKPTGMVGKVVEFDIDASKAGSGNLEIMVNDGTIPTSVQNRGNRQFHASFTPKESIPHYIQMRFNGHEVPGSPWQVDVINSASVIASGNGLQIIPVGRPTQFEVRTGQPNYTGEMTVNITSPSRRPLASRVMNLGGGNYTVEYTPMEVGNHYIDVTYDNVAIPGSPFTSKAYNSDIIQVSQIPTGIVGKPVEFTIDVTQAGEGQLEIMVNRGAVPNSVRMLRKGVFLVSFVPRDSRPHNVDIKFNGELIPRSPIAVAIMDASRITVQGESQVAVNRQSYFRVNTQAAGEADMSVKVTSPKGVQVPTNVVGSGPTGFDIDFKPNEVGTYQVEMQYGDLVVPGSPFLVKVYDPSKVGVQQVQDGIVGRPSGFLVNIDNSGEGNMEISITGPSGGNLQNNVQQLGPGRFEVVYTPMEMGPHMATVTFNKENVPGSPFGFKVVDASLVQASGEGLALVPCGKPTSFAIQAPGAKASDLNIKIIAPNKTEHTVSRITESQPGLFTVEYTPVQAGEHTVVVSYFGQPITGSPFLVKCWNAAEVIVSNIKPGGVGKPSYFNVDASKAGAGNLEITVSVGSQNVPNFVKSEGQARFEVSFTPQVADTHTINVRFNGDMVPGSPFYHAVIDSSQVSASGDGLEYVQVRRPANFQIVTQGAPAEAPIELDITAPSGTQVPGRITGSREKNFNVEWRPTEIGPHNIVLKYADGHIHGSPFTAEAYDIGLVHISDPPTGVLGIPIIFQVDSSEAGNGELSVVAKGQSTTPQVSILPTTARNIFEVSFVPTEPTRHSIDVFFNQDQVPGTPKMVTVLDPGNVYVNWDAVATVPINKQTAIDIDPRGSPLDGVLEASIIDPFGNDVPYQVVRKGSGLQVLFTPKFLGPHNVNLSYGGTLLPGSPATINAHDVARARFLETDPGTVGAEMGANGAYDMQALDPGRMIANPEGCRSIPVGRPAVWEVDPQGLPSSVVEARITDPYGKKVQYQLSDRQPLVLVSYVPQMVGTYNVELFVGGRPVAGSPFQCSAFNVNNVIIYEATENGTVGSELGFAVETTEAGAGDLEVEITYNGQPVPVRHTRIDDFHHQFTFVAAAPGPHNVSVAFNSFTVPNTPFPVMVTDPTNDIFVREDMTMKEAIAYAPAVAFVETQGTPHNINDVAARVIAPNGELVPAKILQQPDGDYKVEYSSRYTGRHTVEIMYAGQAIMGSPFYVEIYDPNKIRVEGTRNGVVGQKMEFDIIRNEAGRAELGLTITSPSGRNLTYDISPLPEGDRVSYVPQEVGAHTIYMTYGGLDVPGTPIKQEIIDSGSAVASGDGLKRALENRAAFFKVDAQGRKGNVDVQVDGPNSIAKVNIEPDNNGRYSVSYVPVEVGVYNVHVRWNGRDIEGSPFHPKVISLDKIRLTSGVDPAGRMDLKLNERKQIEFQTMAAGPGILTATVEGPGGMVPTDVETFDDRYKVSFVPRHEGEYFLRVFYSEFEWPRSPLVGMVGPGLNYGTINHDKVVLTGHGLVEARVREEAEFVIDGTDAGPGTPSVDLRGVKTDVPVRMSALGNNKYRATYSPQVPGAYLLNIMWNDRQVRGSPFKVNVGSTSDASKVFATGEGLRGGIIGRDIRATIDTRRAGPGELTAHCMGPTKVAFSELYDHRDGTFTLNVKPQEPGKHVLQIKYGGEHIPGSPFMLRVAGAPDASKVRVSGPGIEPGILANYESRFIVETRGAGAGQLTVRIRGPKGAFRVEMQRESQKDRTILCRYDPAEVGDYIISVKWSGEHVPGSPFHTQIFDTREELDRFMVDNPQRRHPALPYPDRGRWAEDI